MAKWVVFAVSFMAFNTAMADCLGPFGVIPEGGTILMYRERKPPKGERCQWEYRYCQNGFLSGSYTEPFCTETYSAKAPVTPAQK